MKRCSGRHLKASVRLRDAQIGTPEGARIGNGVPALPDRLAVAYDARMRMHRTTPWAALASLALAACHAPGSDVPGDASDHRPYQGLAVGEVVRLVGTEPFWGGTVAGGRMTYTTPEEPQGQTVDVRRFAGRGGLSFSGALSGGPFTLAITPGDCSDGMSDRTFPFVATLEVGGEIRQGCAWTDRLPYREATVAP